MTIPYIVIKISDNEIELNTFICDDYFSCGDGGDGDECVTTDLTYNNDIAAIIDGSCATAGCHEMGSSTTFEMHDYNAVLTEINGDNRIVGSINHETGFTPMPFPLGEDKIDQCNIDKITSWISDGAPE